MSAVLIAGIEGLIFFVIIFIISIVFKAISAVIKASKESSSGSGSDAGDLWQARPKAASRPAAKPARKAAPPPVPTAAQRRARQGAAAPPPVPRSVPQTVAQPAVTIPAGVSSEAAQAIYAMESADDRFERKQDNAYELEFSDVPESSDDAFSLERKRKQKSRKKHVKINLSGKRLRDAIITREIIAPPRCFDI